MFEDDLDTIDAAIFSGDVLYDDAKRALLKEHLERWSRAIKEHDVSCVECGAIHESGANTLCKL
jgi:hypothetical protein